MALFTVGLLVLLILFYPYETGKVVRATLTLISMALGAGAALILLLALYNLQ